jgi:hypothetical protein
VGGKPYKKKDPREEQALQMPGTSEAEGCSETCMRSSFQILCPALLVRSCPSAQCHMKPVFITKNIGLCPITYRRELGLSLLGKMSLEKGIAIHI